jgi:hypothetical protein
VKLEATIAASVALVLSGLAAGNHVHVVGPGLPFTEIQQAIDAATSTDVILVRSGSYASFKVQAKILTIAWDGEGTRPRVLTARVTGLAAHQRAVLRGLDLGPTQHGSLGVEPLAIEINLGSVLIEDCRVAAHIAAAIGKPALVRVADSARVMFVRSTLRGKDDFHEPATGQIAAGTAGLAISNSGVSLYDCEIHGGAGRSATAQLFLSFSTLGRTALTAVGGTLLIAGGTVRGGDGGSGASSIPVGCLDPASGGPGLVATGTTIRRFDATFAGGTAGVAASGCPANASDGVPATTAGGVLVTFAETLRSLELSSPCVEGDTCTAKLRGKAGDACVLLYAGLPGLAYVGGLKGTLICAFPLQSFFLGVLPPSGEIALPFVLPPNSLPSGIEAAELFVQFDTPGDLGSGVLAAPSTFVLIDDQVN